MTVQTFTFGPFQTNTYVVSVDEENVLLIDPACSTPYEQQVLLTYLERLKADSPKKVTIIATHGHLDHLWGAKWATDQWHTPVLMHEADIPMAEAMQDQYNLFGIRATAEPFPVENIKSSILNLQFSIIETPGHTPGSVCLYFPNEKILISGDTLFCMGYGRTDLPGGDFSQLIQSLNTLFELPAATRVYPGHGQPTTIGAERR